MNISGETRNLMGLARWGDPNAQCKLGKMYQEFGEMEVCVIQAASMFKKSADQGHADAQFLLAQMYEGGAVSLSEDCSGADVDEEAMTYYSRAATQGHRMAIQRLSLVVK